MWKDDAAKLKRWLSGTPNGSSGARDFLMQRMGIRPAVPWTPGHAFGLSVDEPEKMTAPVDWTEAVTSAGADNLKL